MEALMGMLGAAFALLAVFFLYIGGAAIVLRLLERLRPTKDATARDSHISASTS
jgi:hypothetical protein